MTVRPILPKWLLSALAVFLVAMIGAAGFWGRKTLISDPAQTVEAATVQSNILAEEGTAMAAAAIATAGAKDTAVAQTVAAESVKTAAVESTSQAIVNVTSTAIADPDEDGIPTYIEIGNGTNPESRYSDSDLLADNEDPCPLSPDCDNDGIFDHDDANPRQTPIPTDTPRPADTPSPTETPAPDTVEVIVFIESVESVSAIDSFGQVGAPDFKVEVTIDGGKEFSSPVVSDSNPAYFGWPASKPVKFDTDSIPVEIKVFYQDGQDAQITDTVTGSDKGNNPTLKVDLASCLQLEGGAISGDLAGSCGENIVSEGDGSDEPPKARVTFRITANRLG